MCCKTLLAALVGTVLLTTIPASAQSLPDDRYVTYSLRETPTDPNSEIVFTVELELEASEGDGDWIGWEITKAKFVQVGDLDSVWEKQSPAVSTQDGLWWVEHDCPQAPKASEFAMPPGMEGLALPKNPSDDTLEYLLEGVDYTGEQYYEVTAGLDYEFVLEVGQEVLEIGIAEAVETGGGIIDPPNS